MGRSLILVLAILAASGARAEEQTASPPDDRPRPHGIFSHGDSGDLLEDFYGGSVERKAPEDTTATRKRDPGIRWEGPPGVR